MKRYKVIDLRTLKEEHFRTIKDVDDFMDHHERPLDLQFQEFNIKTKRWQ